MCLHTPHLDCPVQSQTRSHSHTLYLSPHLSQLSTFSLCPSTIHSLYVMQFIYGVHRYCSICAENREQRGRRREVTKQLIVKTVPILHDESKDSKFKTKEKAGWKLILGGVVEAASYDLLYLSLNGSLP